MRFKFIKAKAQIAKFKRDINKKTKKIAKQYVKVAPKVIRREVLLSIGRGANPVNVGKSRYVQYSDSYKMAIQNKAAFWIGKGGKVHMATNFKKAGVRVKDINASTSDKGRRQVLKDQLKANEAFIKEHNKHLAGKRIAPRNLRVSFTLLRSFFWRAKGKVLVVGFNHFLADIHNRVGPAGKKSAVRRMLPTNPGEQFRRPIQKKLTLLVDKIMRNTLK